jgi:hypothetical protein
MLTLFRPRLDILTVGIVLTCIMGCSQNVSAQEKSYEPKTICNPLNLNYRFCMDEPSRREAADPTMVMFKDEYYLFASKCGGYYVSKDMIDWELITTDALDYHIEDYAPTVVVIKDKLYFLSSSQEPKVFSSSDPKSGKWDVVNPNFQIPMIDPDLLLDDDGKLYFYYGCSDVEPIRGVELDIETFNPIGEPVALFAGHPDSYGWERFGDYNDMDDAPWIEGPWMTKYGNKYYLQYASPGTQFKSYCDGVYESDNPLGPFTLAKHNPFSYKPGGFVSGAGHGSTFQDRYGNYWHIASMTISNKHIFERRLGLFPVFFDKDGVMYADTSFGDLPYVMPDEKIESAQDFFSGWNLLSYGKPVEVSSQLSNHPASFASDNDIRTFWSAASGQPGEWMMIDLKDEMTVNAVQINYAENDTKITGEMIGRDPAIYHQYLLEYSSDKEIWKNLVDKRDNKVDVPHDYIELPNPVKARYIRLSNKKVPDGTFAIADLRVFGKASKPLPGKVANIVATREEKDPCTVRLLWNASPDAVGYNVKFGTAVDKRYSTFEIRNTNELLLHSLNKDLDYYFSIDAFNENGVTVGDVVVKP